MEEDTKPTRRYNPLYDGAQWHFIRPDGEELSIICHKGSYGGTRGYFEAWGMGGEPLGWLDFDDCARVIALFMAGEKRREKYEEATKSPKQDNTSRFCPKWNRGNK